MIIAANTVVTLDFELSDIWGNLIEHPEQPVQYLHGSYGDIFPAVEAALEGKSANDRVDVRLEPEDAFGDYDEDLLRVEARAIYPEPLEVGMRFEGPPGSDSEGQFFTVTDIADGKVVLDGNHPLAGMALKFTATVVSVRPANADEIANGSADDASAVLVRAIS
jgi:FKBP-type peptidyl-prolyl cis-trans isomerase SlyD